MKNLMQEVKRMTLGENWWRVEEPREVRLIDLQEYQKNKFSFEVTREDGTPHKATVTEVACFPFGNQGIGFREAVRVMATTDDQHELHYLLKDVNGKDYKRLEEFKADRHNPKFLFDEGELIQTMGTEYKSVSRGKFEGQVPTRGPDGHMVSYYESRKDIGPSE
jgi:hypothetical protein